MRTQMPDIRIRWKMHALSAKPSKGAIHVGVGDQLRE
jgi:hypothetical protein